MNVPEERRITRTELFLTMALEISKRSTCKRKHVGALLVKDNRPLSMGYAGSPSGLPHCTDKTCNSSKPCDNTIHAEVNAIAFAAKEGIATKDAVMYSTLSCCINCAKLMINAGIKEFIYLEDYRTSEGLDLMKEAGVVVTKFRLR